MIDIKKNLGGNSTSTDVGKDGSSFGHFERLSVLLLVVVLVSLRVVDDDNENATRFQQQKVRMTRNEREKQRISNLF